MVKIAHEAPLLWFDVVQNLTDYDYCLVHLCEENPAYLEKFIQARELGREIILDNSVFELEEVFNPVTFARWIDIIKPTEYIIPDKLEDAHTTVRNVQEWDYTLPGKSIGVVQGKTFEDIIWCYKEIEPFVDKIAISFDYSYYEAHYPAYNKLISWSNGRVMLLNRLLDEGIINTNKPHHLLGCSIPLEFMQYNFKDRFKWIESLDTSNPVMWAFVEGSYPHDMASVVSKPGGKLFKIMDYKTQTPDDYSMLTTSIIQNITQFRRITLNDR